MRVTPDRVGVPVSLSTRRRILAIGVAVFLGVYAIALAPARASTQSIQLGAYTPYAPANSQVLDNYAAMVGRKPDIVMFYRDFTVPLMTQDQITNLQARGETPMVTWEPDQPGSGFPVASLSDIAAGNYDSYVRQAADLARGLPFDVMIRFAHEMNISASPWGPGKEGNVGTTYVDAWRHIVSIFRQEGATNVKWVWSPNVDWGGVPFAQYFPGDSWVDYVALDGYNWGTVGTEAWQSMYTLFHSSYMTLTQMSQKPVIIAEASSGELGGSKASWILDGFLHTIPEQFPRVSAVIWFNSVAEEDWRINTSQAALDAYRQVVSNSLYGGSDPAPAATTTEVQALQVTPSSTGGSTAKSAHRHTQRTGKRVRVRYRLSSPAEVRIEVRSAVHRRTVFTMTVHRRKRRWSVWLARLVHGHKLRHGFYKISATAIGESGILSKPEHTRFRVV